MSKEIHRKRASRLRAKALREQHDGNNILSKLLFAYASWIERNGLKVRS
jgi:hypothetical protein